MVLMPLDTPLSWTPDLEEAIERQPLTVPPTTPLVEVTAMLIQTHSHLCMLYC